jgi:hypothetical protein
MYAHSRYTSEEVLRVGVYQFEQAVREVIQE